MKTWRDSAVRIAQKIVDQKPLDKWTEKDLRKAMRDGYPWGERKMWPYKVWLKVTNDFCSAMFPDRGGDMGAQIDFGLFAKDGDQ